MTRNDFDKYYDNYIFPLINLFIANNPVEGSNSTHKFTVRSSNVDKGVIYEEYMNQRTFFRVLLGKPLALPDNEYAEKNELCRHKVCACMTVALIKARPLIIVNHPEAQFTLADAPRLNEQLALSVGLSMLRMYILREDNEDEKARAEYFKETVYHLAKPFPRQAKYDDSPQSVLTRSIFQANVAGGLNVVLLADLYFQLDRYHEAQYKVEKYEALLKEHGISY